MTVKKTLCAILSTIAIGMTGCSELRNNPEPEQTIEGIPLEVSNTHGQSSGVLAVRLNTGESEVDVYAQCDSTKDCALSALNLKYEINDGDEQSVSFTGRYDNDGNFGVTKISTITQPRETVSLRSCSEIRRNPEPYERLEGRPLTVVQSYARSNGTVAVRMQANNSLVDAYASCSGMRDCVLAELMLQREIDDFDQENVTLIGRYDKQGDFQIKEIRSAKRIIDFNFYE